MTVEQWQYSTGDSYSYGLTTKLFKNRIFVVRSYSWGIYIEDVDGSSEYSFKSLHVPEEIRDYLKLLQK